MAIQKKKTIIYLDMYRKLLIFLINIYLLLRVSMYILDGCENKVNDHTFQIL